jgi:hypothetical protein
MSNLDVSTKMYRPNTIALGRANGKSFRSPNVAASAR